MYIKTFKNFKDIHSICEKYRIKNYTINPDGSIDVDGNVYLEDKRLTKIPLKFAEVNGNFWCNNNDIWTFEDFNTSIGGDFICYLNPISKIWDLFRNTEKLELLNEIDAIRPGRIIILDRLNEFLIMIGEKPVQKIDGYTCI